MTPEKELAQRLEQLAEALGRRDSFVDEVMNRIEHAPVQPGSKQKRTFGLGSIIMNKSFIKTAAAILVIGSVWLLFFQGNSTLYARVVRAMERARTVHAVGYRRVGGELVWGNEMWYARGEGFRMSWEQSGTKHVVIDNGRHRWVYQAGQDFAGQSKSVTAEMLPREITETGRYIDRCALQRETDAVIDGFACDLYVGSYPDKPDTTQLMYWVDRELRPRRFEERVLEGRAWVTVERVEIAYNVEIDPAVFRPDFGTGVRIVDEEKVLEERFSLDEPLFQQEEMDLVFAVHEVKRCEGDLIYVVSSLRPNEKLTGKYARKGITAWNYGDYQFGASYERLGPDEHHSFGPIELASFYQDGLLIRWTVFIPRGFAAGEVNEIPLELYYLYASGSWAAERLEAGLEDRKRIKPITVLPLPDEAVTLESRLRETYGILELLKPMTADVRLQLTPVPFTDEEMEEFTRQHPEGGTTKAYRNDPTHRLMHGLTAQPGEIEFEAWMEDRARYIERFRSQ